MIEKFREVDDEIKRALAGVPSKLRLGLCVLTLAQDKFGTEYLSLEEIAEALDRLGIAVERANLGRAFSRAGDRIRRVIVEGVPKYKVMTKGRQEVEDIVSIPGPQVIYIEGGQPRTTRKTLAEILGDLQGTIRILDPYYGLRSLDVLEAIPHMCEVRFLTARTSERAARLQSAISDFKNERPNVEFRVYPRPEELHDRYVIGEDYVLILGHGLKDIGSKESFLIRLDSQIAPDLIPTLISRFDQRWSEGQTI